MIFHKNCHHRFWHKKTWRYEIKSWLTILYTAKTQYRKFETNIPRKVAGPQSLFPHLCEWFMYSHDRSAYSAAGKYVDPSWEYINRSQTRECGNWNWGRANPLLGIHKWDLLQCIKTIFLNPCSPPPLPPATTICLFFQTLLATILFT